MAVDTPHTVDMVSDGPPGSIVLTITDHLDWDDSISHQRTLQSKINCYLRFVESGQMLQQFPDAEGKRVAVRVLGLSEPDAAGRQFLDRMESALAQAGYQFLWSLFNPAGAS